MSTENLKTLRQLVVARPFLSERWVRSLVDADRIPHYKLGGKLLFDLDEIDDFVRKTRSGPAQDVPAA